MAPLDWIIAGLYFFGTIVFGIWLNRKTKNTKEFFSGGKDFAWWAIAGSVISTQVSAVTFVGAPGWAYNEGLAPIVLSLNIPLVMWYISGNIVPFFYNSGVVSIYEYMEGRFGYAARATMAQLYYKTARYYGGGYFCPSPGTILCNRYGHCSDHSHYDSGYFYYFARRPHSSYLGGCHADCHFVAGYHRILCCCAFQTASLLTGSIYYSGESRQAKALSFSTDLSTSNTFWGGIIGGLVLHISYFGANQAQVQRMLAAKSIRNLKLSLWSTGYAIVAQMMFFLVLGLLLFVFYEGKQFEKANDVFVSFLDYVPTGFLGLIIAAVSAAAIGSMVASLNSMATVFVKDIYERVLYPKATEKNKLLMARLSTLVFGTFLAGAAILMSKYESISALEAISKYGSYIIGSTLGAFILGIYTQRTNEAGVIIGLVVGVVAVACFALFTDAFWLWYNLVGLVVTLGSGLWGEFCFRRQTCQYRHVYAQRPEAAFP
jgi:Na+/proline symporter